MTVELPVMSAKFAPVSRTAEQILIGAVGTIGNRINAKEEKVRMGLSSSGM